MPGSGKARIKLPFCIGPSVRRLRAIKRYRGRQFQCCDGRNPPRIAGERVTFRSRLLPAYPSRLCRDGLLCRHVLLLRGLGAARSPECTPCSPKCFACGLPEIGRPDSLLEGGIRRPGLTGCWVCFDLPAESTCAPVEGSASFERTVLSGVSRPATQARPPGPRPLGAFMHDSSRVD